MKPEYKIILKNGFVINVSSNTNPVDMFKLWTDNASSRPYATLEVPGKMVILMSEIAAITEA